MRAHEKRARPADTPAVLQLVPNVRPAGPDGPFSRARVKRPARVLPPFAWSRQLAINTRRGHSVQCVGIACVRELSTAPLNIPPQAVCTISGKLYTEQVSLAGIGTSALAQARQAAVIRMALLTTKRLVWHCGYHCEAEIGLWESIPYRQNLLFFVACGTLCWPQSHPQTARPRLKTERPDGHLLS